MHHACYYILIHPKARDRRYHPGDYRGHACWIGLRERKKHGVKKWMDNTDVTYKKWWRGQSRYWRHDQHANNQKHRSLLAVALSEETYDEQEMGRDYGDWYSDYGHHRCVEMYRNGWWRERRCYEKKACVCQDPRARVVGKYIGISAVKSYHEAEKYCYKHYGTALATISNDAENKEVMKACREVTQPNSHRFCWIGYTYFLCVDYLSALSLYDVVPFIIQSQASIC